MIECGLSPDNRTNLRRLTPKLISLKHLKPNRKDSKFKLLSDVDNQVKNILSDFLSNIEPEEKEQFEVDSKLKLLKQSTMINKTTTFVTRKHNKENYSKRGSAVSIHKHSIVNPHHHSVPTINLIQKQDDISSMVPMFESGLGNEGFISYSKNNLQTFQTMCSELKKNIVDNSLLHPTKEKDSIKETFINSQDKELESSKNKNIDKKSTSKSKRVMISQTHSLKNNFNSIKLTSSMKKQKTNIDFNEDSDYYSGDRKRNKSNKLIKTKATYSKKKTKAAEVLEKIESNIEQNFQNLKNPDKFYSNTFSKITLTNKTINKKLDSIYELLKGL